MMKEKALCDFVEEKKNLVINIRQNEFVFFDNKKYSSKIIGLFTDSIVIISLLLISINSDEFIFFCHIDENSNIIEVIKMKIIPLFSKIKINNLCVIYTEGIGPIKNTKKNLLIKEVIEIIDEKFHSEKKVYRHGESTSCLKFIKNSSNQIESLMNKILQLIMNYQKWKKLQQNFQLILKAIKAYLKKVYSKMKKLFFILIPIQ